ncbi:hypothetical protein EVAR_64284_1 [Eumeta japonica]|uniref:Mariner Mos1 transposase n=1 Tax=Eumeta variegata TaxID=151549 RepID=A0A4C1ZRI6_EUMVA|nr:hypothetical protein EVAR_64284_1 [Eumeta japonica]
MDVLLHAGKKATVFCMDFRRRQQTNNIEASEKRRQKDFFSKAGPLRTVPLEEQNTVNAERYTTICLPSILEKVREKQPRIRMLSHHHDASPHTANKTIPFSTSEKVKLVTHPAFNPDLAPRGLIFTEPEETV